MVEIGLGIAFFTGIVLLLVLVILAARSQLVETGRVDITVNDKSTIKEAVGGKLLEALSSTGRLRRHWYLRTMPDQGDRGRRRGAAD